MHQKLSSLATTLSILTVMSGLLVLGGCTSTRQSKDKQALVCPECKMVATTVNRPNFIGYGSYSGYGYGGTSGYGLGSAAHGGTQTVYNDTCPGNSVRHEKCWDKFWTKNRRKSGVQRRCNQVRKPMGRRLTKSEQATPGLFAR